MKELSSESNPAFRRWLRLAQSPRATRELGQTLAEGMHLAQAALDAGVSVGAALLRRGADARHLDALLSRCAQAPCYELAPALYDRLSPVEHGAGIMLVIEVRAAGAPLHVREDLVYLDGIQDPGNVGALLRTAAAAGVRRILAGPGTAALWAPKVMRAAMGAHFHLHLTEAVAPQSLGGALDGVWIGALAHGAESLWKAALPQRALGWVFGAEGAGPSEAALVVCNLRVRVPTDSGVESLNVAAAAAVCLFERRRRLAES